MVQKAQLNLIANTLNQVTPLVINGMLNPYANPMLHKPLAQPAKEKSNTLKKVFKLKIFY